MSRLSVLFDAELPSRAITVYLILNEYSNSNGNCYPSLKTLAQDSGLSKRTVQRAINDLVNAGFITKEQRTRSNGALSSCLYHLPFKCP